MSLPATYVRSLWSEPPCIDNAPTMHSRFWAKVRKDPSTGCWEWTAATSDGYGHFAVKKGDIRAAHRVAWEMLRGPVPDGLHIDHLCRNRACVNPDHMEPVSCRTNILRGIGPSARHAIKTHCPQGHEYSPDNTYHYRGQRHCRACRRAWRESTRVLSS